MKQLFKPQLKMEQFIFKLEPSSAEQEGGRGPALGPLVPCRTRSTGHWSHPAPSRKAEEWSRGFQQPHKAVLAASSPSHSCPSLAQPIPDLTNPVLSHEGRGFGLYPWEGSTAWMGAVFGEAPAPLGSFPSNQGLVFFIQVPITTTPQCSGPKNQPWGLRPVCPREVTSNQHPMPGAGSTLDSKGWLGGSWGGREGRRKSSNHNKNPPSLFIRQQNLSACSPSHLSPHTK